MNLPPLLTSASEILSVGSIKATPLARRGETVSIFNSDSSATIVIGTEPGLLYDDANGIPLGPGQPITFNGEKDWYGISPSGLQLVAFRLPGVSQFRQPGSAPSTVTPTLKFAALSTASTIDLIGGTGFPNPNGYPVQIRQASIAASMSGQLSSPSSMSAVFQDGTPTAFLGCPVTLPQDPTGTGQSNSNSVSLNMDNIEIADGRVQASIASIPSGAIVLATFVLIFYLVVPA